MSKKINIAIVQTSIKWEDTQGNLDKYDNIINSIVDSVYEETISTQPEPTSKLKLKKKKNYVGEHPFN